MPKVCSLRKIGSSLLQILCHHTSGLHLLVVQVVAEINEFAINMMCIPKLSALEWDRGLQQSLFFVRKSSRKYCELYLYIELILFPLLSELEWLWYIQYYRNYTRLLFCWQSLFTTKKAARRLCVCERERLKMRHNETMSFWKRWLTSEYSTQLNSSRKRKEVNSRVVNSTVVNSTVVNSTVVNSRVVEHL